MIMKVKELIQLLQEKDPDMLVILAKNNICPVCGSVIITIPEQLIENARKTEGYQKTIKSVAENMSKEIDEIIINDLLNRLK